MNSSPCKCSEAEIRALSRQIGAVRCGTVGAEEVEHTAREQYRNWLAEGRNGTMEYCSRYQEVRDDPRLLLPGCKTLIVCAFSYYTGSLPRRQLQIARYALGEDYHTVLTRKMQEMADALTDKYGGETLVAVDTKPLRERYWAQRAGVGVIGRNNQLIVPGAGSYVFLATLLWTGDVTPEASPEHVEMPDCSGCGDCLRACPNGALHADGSCDARRCISYLTIEHKGDIPEDITLAGWTYGCDICQRVCRHNRNIPITQIEEFKPREELLQLTPEQLQSHSNRSWRRFLGSSAMQRVPLSRLLSICKIADR